MSCLWTILFVLHSLLLLFQLSVVGPNIVTIICFVFLSPAELKGKNLASCSEGHRYCLYVV